MAHKKLSTIFFGTYTFAEKILQFLINSEMFDVQRIITREDQPLGRKKILTAPPTKIIGQKNGILVEQPKSLKNYTLSQTFDIGIVAQYGKIIPTHILNAPTHGLINIHTSLLPHYRGASPIQSALLAGDTETGVTIMQMDAGLDTGPIIAQQSIPIKPDDTYLDVEDNLITAACAILPDAIHGFVTETIIAKPQDNSQATECGKISRDDGKIDWLHMNTDEIYNRYRAYTPWPGIWTMFDDKRLKLLTIQKNKKKFPNTQPGSVHIEDNKLFIATYDGSIEVLNIQLAGKPPMTITQFLPGYAQKISKKVLS